MSTRPTVCVKQGQLQGLERETENGKKFYSFKGIPYAEPPIGELRFKGPIPAKPWKDVRDASKEGKNCVHYSPMQNNEFVGDEDCLFLNVYSPALSDNASKKYPVLVFIHGGGFIMGSGDESEFGPEFLLDNDIVIVTINYRLGIFGFLCLDIPQVPGNAGLKDQQLALKWVKENIEYFNGDPENITLEGASAGSVAAEYHLLNPKSQGLFHKVIMHSGAILTAWATPRTDRNIVLKKLANALDIENDPYKLLNKLNTMTSEELLKTSMLANDEELRKSGLVFTQFTPVIEKSFLNVESFITKQPLELYKGGHFLKVPTITAFCRDEGHMLLYFLGDFLAKSVLNREYAELMSFLNIEDKEDVNKGLTDVYEAMTVDEERQAKEFMSDLIFFCGTYQSMKYLAKSKDSKHYCYMFNYESQQSDIDYEEFGIDPSNSPGVSHCIDMSYYTKNVYTKSMSSSKDREVKELMLNIYRGFTHHSDPSKFGALEWLPTTEKDFKILEIDGEENKMITFPFGDRMRYWDSLFH